MSSECDIDDIIMILTLELIRKCHNDGFHVVFESIICASKREMYTSVSIVRIVDNQTREQLYGAAI